MKFASPRSAATPLAASLALAFSASAFAQAAADRKADTVVVTATRTPEVSTEVLADNVIITAEEIARSGETTLVNLLQRQRGIEVARNGGPGTTASVFIRGTNNNQSVVLVDGVRIGSSTTGGATWSAVPLTQIDHIEIIYGPLSSLYGADAIGGVVQIFTKQGESAPTVTAAAGIGSYNTHTFEGGVSGATSGDNGPRWRYALRAAHEDSDGFSATKPGAFGYNPDKDGYKNDSVSGRFSAEWAKGHEAGINLLQSRLDSQFDASPNFDDRSLQHLGTIAFFSKDQLTQHWRSTVQLARSDDKTDSTTSFGTTRFNTRQNLYSWQNDIALGSDVVQLVAERREETVDSTTADLNRSRNTNAFAGAYQLRRGSHLVSASLRNDNSSQFGSHTTGSLAYGYRISSTLRVNASYGTSFRAPTFNELYFPGYGFAGNRPEKGRNTEAGVYYDDGKSALSAVVYRNRITDLIVSTPVCPTEQSTHPFGCAYNVNQALLTGLTLGGSTRLGATTLRASIDVQDPRDETTDHILARRSRQHAAFGIDHAIGRGLVGADWTVFGKRYDDPANSAALGGFGVLDLHANYALTKDWSVVGRWNNVLNKNYELARYYATPESNLFVGVRYGMR